ncbi:DUF4267 domain-containing protein [Kitasatospora cinereorecta]|uniref:DUF4267 domain-containing protein n=1 Tax=Kitasatospora cinereorecta TaxID=285560 RepID=A0ABW0VIL1_9ACTN
MATTLAYGFSTVLDLLVLFIGARFLLVPRAAAAGYGVPAVPNGDPAYLTVKGVRDLASGVIGLALLVAVGLRAEAWYMLAVALVPLRDTVVVLRNGGTRAAAFGIHFATAVLVLADAAFLFTF